MYHHVCPAEKVPTEADRAGIEGWSYNLEPRHFERQLQLLMQRGFKFVAMDEYVRRCSEGRLDWGTLSVTFDDGWLDNYRYAAPILDKHRISATIFVVAGEMAQVSPQRRMNDVQLRELADMGMTVGAHSRTHRNLTELSNSSLQAETVGCKDDLEQRLGRAVDVFAYPGGRFSRRVASACQAAGYKAACCSIGGGLNGKGNLFWLYRDIFSDRMGSLRDRILLNGYARKLVNKRASGKVELLLGDE